jgi:hypothetical protein
MSVFSCRRVGVYASPGGLYLHPVQEDGVTIVGCLCGVLDAAIRAGRGEKRQRRGRESEEDGDICDFHNVKRAVYPPAPNRPQPRPKNASGGKKIHPARSRYFYWKSGSKSTDPLVTFIPPLAGFPPLRRNGALPAPARDNSGAAAMIHGSSALVAPCERALQHHLAQAARLLSRRTLPHCDCTHGPPMPAIAASISSTRLMPPFRRGATFAGAGPRLR